jgi:hypothetical protein
MTFHQEIEQEIPESVWDIFHQFSCRKYKHFFNLLCPDKQLFYIELLQPFLPRAF